MSIKRVNAGPRMSSAVVHGDTVYLAGLTADDTKLDVKGQTKQILDKVDKFLAEAGTDKSKVLSANIWLTDIGPSLLISVVSCGDYFARDDKRALSSSAQKSCPGS